MQTKEGGVKMVPEVFLPRLLATKVNNDLFFTRKTEGSVGVSSVYLVSVLCVH